MQQRHHIFQNYVLHLMTSLTLNKLQQPDVNQTTKRPRYPAGRTTKPEKVGFTLPARSIIRPFYTGLNLKLRFRFPVKNERMTDLTAQ